MCAVETGAPARAARVFLSYKRDVEPDQALAGEIVRGLERVGHGVFIDQRLIVGQAWAREIEKQVRDADYLIVFLTADSSSSEMVRGEIEMARHHAASAGHPHILPVRVKFDGPLPYPLNAYLDSIQYATWNQRRRYAAPAAGIGRGHGRPCRWRARILVRPRRLAERRSRRRTRRRCQCPAEPSTSTIRGTCRDRQIRRRCRWPRNRARP